VLPPEQRKGSGSHVPAFVRYQVLGHSKAEILRDVANLGVSSEKAVEKACAGIAAVAGIKLRQVPRGDHRGGGNQTAAESRLKLD
jgi:hypothetical protein